MSPLTSFSRVAIVLLSVACGGGGGGGGSNIPAPTLVSAAWIGGGSIPSPGDVLELLFSQDVVVISNTAFDGNDLALSSGSLGAVPGPPSQPSARVLRVTLGSGVSLVPGVTTIDLKTGNDAVKGTGGKLAEPSAPRTISDGDGAAPLVSRLTLNSIDGVLNGTGPAGGTLQVPRSGFTVDIAHSDASGVDTARTVIVASVDVSTATGTRTAGTDLKDAMAATTTASASSFMVPETTVFPETTCTLTAYVVDTTGRVSSPATFTFRVRALSDALRPFENGQSWFLDLSRDIESYAMNLGSVVQPVAVVAGANGRSDFDDLMLAVGLLSATPLPNVSGSLDSNQVVSTQLQAKILNELALLYSGTSETFTFTSPGTFPSGQSSVAYGSFPFSQICIAGAEVPSGLSGVLGVALFDPHNASQDNNCLTDYGGQRLGVFLHTMVNTGMQPPAGSLFRTTYDPLTPARSGTPIGNDPQDGSRLLGTLSDARATMISNAISRMGRFTAVVVAHEMGHSVGLVKDGAMPDGLYGGDSANFPGSSSGHIRMPTSVFPAGTSNVMSPSLAFDSAQSAQTTFNTLNLAYLRERVVVN
jgi:hypothetical protein